MEDEVPQVAQDLLLWVETGGGDVPDAFRTIPVEHDHLLPETAVRCGSTNAPKIPQRPWVRRMRPLSRSNQPTENVGMTCRWDG